MMVSGVIIEPIFVHNPIGFLSVWGSSFVKHESLPHPDSSEAAAYDLIPARCFPESSGSGTVRPSPCWILLVFVTEEVPIILWGGSYFALLCTKMHGKLIAVS